MKIRILTALLLLGALGACSTTTASKAETAAQAEIDPEAASAAMETGRELTKLFYAGETGAIWARMNDQMRGAIGSEENLSNFRKQVEAQAGEETELIEENTEAAPPHVVYLRKAKFSKSGSPVIVQWALDSEGKISGFFVRPAQ